MAVKGPEGAGGWPRPQTPPSEPLPTMEAAAGRRPRFSMTSRLDSLLSGRSCVRRSLNKRVTPVSFLVPTAKEKGEKKLFGFSFVPLMQEDGRTLPDGTHELIVHKVPAAGGGRRL